MPEPSGPDPATMTEPTPTPPPDPAPTTPAAFTQADVDRIVSERVGREKARYADYADLKARAEKLAEIESANQTELEKAQQLAEQSTRRLAEYEQANLRQRIALEKGLPASLVSRLQGSTEEEVSSDADALMELLKVPTTTPRPDPSQGARNTSAQEEADAEYERFFPSTPIQR